MEWYLVLFLALFLGAAIAFWLMRRRSAHTERVGIDRLETRLSELGVDPGSDATPPIELLRLHIRNSDAIIAATRARTKSKKAIIVLLDDRLVYVAATVGRVGAEAEAVPYDRIQDVESEPHVGGTLRLETTRGPISFSHIPLQAFSDIINTLHQQVRGETPANRPLRPAADI